MTYAILGAKGPSQQYQAKSETRQIRAAIGQSLPGVCLEYRFAWRRSLGGRANSPDPALRSLVLANSPVPVRDVIAKCCQGSWYWTLWTC